MLVKKTKKEDSKKFLNSISSLNKLRYYVAIIFLLSTLSIILIVTSIVVIGAVLVILSYLMVFVLMIKLFMIKQI